MNLLGFTEKMSQRGCVVKDKVFCGSFNSYAFTATYAQGNGSTTNWILNVHVPGAGKQLKKNIQADLKGRVKITSIAALNNAAVVNVRAKDTDLDRTFDILLESITDAARRLSLTAQGGKCPLCGAPGCDSYAYLMGSYQPAHATCVQNMAMTSQQKADKNQQDGSYLLGFLGALLGAFAGGIPSLLTMYFMEGTVFWLLYALVPLGAYQGYKLLRGRLTRVATILTILACVIAIPAIHYVSKALQLYDYYGTMITIAEYQYLFKRSPVDMWSDYGMLGFGTLIGIFIMWGVISRTSVSEVKDASFSATSLRPIN